MKDAILKAEKEILGIDTRHKIQDWITSEIVELLINKKIYKNKDEKTFKIIMKKKVNGWTRNANN